MRILYVAVTRVQHAVAFVGTEFTAPRSNGPGDAHYSWKDEVMRTWSSLEPPGAVEGVLRNRATS